MRILGHAVIHCLLLVRQCCVSFEHLQRAKHLQNRKLFFVILYFEGVSYYQIFINERFLCHFVDFLNLNFIHQC